MADRETLAQRKTLGNVLLRVDQFHEPFQLRLGNSQSSVKSTVGGLFTLLLFLIILIYSLQKTSILINKSDTRVNEYKVPYYFDNDYELTFDKGFNLAFAFTNVFNPSLFDRSYGHFSVNFVSYEIDVNKKQLTRNEE